MSSHVSPPTSSAFEQHSLNDMQQRFLSNWLFAQPAYEATNSALKSRNIDLSPSQIDAILSIRKRIAAAPQFHD